MQQEATWRAAQTAKKGLMSSALLNLVKSWAEEFWVRGIEKSITGIVPACNKSSYQIFSIFTLICFSYTPVVEGQSLHYYHQPPFGVKQTCSGCIKAFWYRYWPPTDENMIRERLNPNEYTIKPKQWSEKKQIKKSWNAKVECKVTWSISRWSESDLAL